MRGLLFYGGPRLAHPNVEAPRKAQALARHGYDVVYVPYIGIRNPGLGDAARTFAHLREKVKGAGEPTIANGLRTASLLVIPPRELSLVEMLNSTLVEKQLRPIFTKWQEAVVWTRWPTPEVVEALARLQPAATVYECVDAYWVTPGIVGKWADRYDRAERALVDYVDLVVASTKPSADRFRRMGADVALLPHGVDLFAWNPEPLRRSEPVVGFVGTLDYRLDIPVLRAVAEAHPSWRVRLIGPIQSGFEPELLADLANVSVEPPIAYERLPSILADLDAGLMPYFDHPIYTHMCPVKNLEFLAAGKPAVARPSPALERFAHLLYFAQTPRQFVQQLERALAEDSRERASERRAAAEENTWDDRLAQMVGLVDSLV